MRNNKSFTPLLMSICIVLGIFIGTFIATHLSGNKLNIINSGSNRLTSLLHIIEDQYVDDINIDSLVEKTMPKILAELDPHSTYISADVAASYVDDLKGSFSGIGVEFIIHDDTIHINNVISNGPAERAGLLAGDKIVKIDNKPFVGKIVTNEEAMKRLKGPKDTKVTVGVIRYGDKKLHSYTIIRGDIPVKSVTAAYMLDETTGYIRLKNFGETTYAELLIALATLSQQEFQSLVIDLRGNGGGYLQSAVQIANEFLPKNKLIVYTKGRKSPRQDYRSDGHGSYQNLPLVVLLDELSASSSEILAGALQDNDRATIIGRRSFGKGLVQQQIDFRDGSLIRLTVARYYTPSGRCIQKPYTANNEDYEQDVINRYQNGEFFSEDSIKHSGVKYHTSKGKVVYGGGGITPDIFVPEDTTNVTSYYRQAAMSGLILQFAYNYTDANRSTLSNYTTCEEMTKYLNKQNLVEKFAIYANQHGLKRRNLMITKSYKLLERYITSRIIYNILDENAWSEYVNADDPTVLEAINTLKGNKD